MTLEADVQQGWHDAIIELFDLDLEPITGDPQDKFYFTIQLKPDNSKIVWKGNTYEPLPIIAAGYERSTTGQIAQPSLTVANVLGTFTQVISNLDDLVGAKVTRRRTLGKYLDGEPQADPTQEFPLDIFYIERKTSENALTISWQLASVLDLEGLQLPRRIITQNYCQWKYRSSECGYTGPPLFTASDEVISTTGQSAEGAAVINGYNLVKQREKELEGAIVIYNQALNNREQRCSTFVLLESRFNPGTDFVKGGPGFAIFGFSVREGVWGGSVVTLGNEYRQGPSAGTNIFRIERWGVDASACSIAESELATANTNLTTARNNLSAAQTALTNATNALPANDALWNQDICGKRIGSCNLRFEKVSLPFGGFPGAIRGRQ